MTQPKPRHSALDIARAAPAGAQTPERKRFAKLLAQIEAAKQRLAAWQQNLPVFAAAYDAQVRPINERLAKARRAWAFELEQLLLGGSKWSKAEKKTLARLISQLAADGLDGADDPELLALHDRHAGVDHASSQQQGLETVKAMMEQMVGFDLGDEPVDSPEELMRRAHEQMARQREQEPPPRRRRQSAAEKRAAEDAQRVSQTVREVYRKLAAALHPDRAEAGATAEQMAQRHEQMARANTAYEAGDLLALLSLQLQIEQVDLARAAQLEAAQVRHFNKVLAEQLAELEAEISDREMAFLGSYGIAAVKRPHPDKLGPYLKDEVQDALAAEAALAFERRTLAGDLTGARRLLKQMAAEFRFEDDLERLLPF